MSSVERREVHLTIPVAPEMEIVATALVSALGELMSMERDKIDEVKMAVVESCINAFEHSATPDHRVEIDRTIEDGQAFAKALRQHIPSKLELKLREQTQHATGD